MLRLAQQQMCAEELGADEPPTLEEGFSERNQSTPSETSCQRGSNNGREGGPSTNTSSVISNGLGWSPLDVDDYDGDIDEEIDLRCEDEDDDDDCDDAEVAWICDEAARSRVKFDEGEPEVVDVEVKSPDSDVECVGIPLPEGVCGSGSRPIDVDVLPAGSLQAAAEMERFLNRRKARLMDRKGWKRHLGLKRVEDVVKRGCLSDGDTQVAEVSSSDCSEGGGTGAPIRIRSKPRLRGRLRSQIPQPHIYNDMMKYLLDLADPENDPVGSKRIPTREEVRTAKNTMDVINVRHDPVDDLLSNLSCPVCYRSYRRPLQQRRPIIEGAPRSSSASSGDAPKVTRKRRRTSSSSSTDLLPPPLCSRCREEVASGETEASELVGDKNQALLFNAADETMDIRFTACGHHFCHSCIERFVRSCKQCPMCKRRLTMNQVFPLYF